MSAWCYGLFAVLCREARVSQPAWRKLSVYLQAKIG
jgi:hypothetical protein